MIEDQNRTYDGFQTLIGGQDAGKRPSLLDESQCAAAENAVFRGGDPATRPAIVERPFVFKNNVTYDPNGGHATTPLVGSQVAFTTGLFQGCSYFDPSLNEDCIMVSVSGRLFRIVPRRTTADVSEIYLANRNRSNIPICYQFQADRFHITQDGESKAIIYDGVDARRANDDELPVGTIGTYGMGRIVQVMPNKRDILFGDLFGSHEGDPGMSVLKFTETTFLTEGGAATIPFTMGHITGAKFYPQQDTSMGQGELLVFAEKGMASFFLSQPRDQWKQSSFQRMGLIEIGGRGHRAFTPVNGDMWFRAGDGWRAYRQARAEAKGWFQLPLSNEVGNYVDVETQSLLEFSSSIHSDNRLIATVTPYPNQGKLYNNGLVALDFNVLSSFGQANKPSWDGHWSGLKVLQLVEGNFGGERRAFAFGLDSDGLNALYEITNDVADTSGPITSSLVTRSFNFQQPYNENCLYDGDMWFESVRADTDVEVWFKPDQYPSWVPWRTATQNPLPTLEPINNVGTIAGIPTQGEGFMPRGTGYSLGQPDNSYDTATTNRDLKRSYELQCKIQWTGNLAINRFRVHDQRRVEESTASVKA